MKRLILGLILCLCVGCGEPPTLKIAAGTSVKVKNTNVRGVVVNDVYNVWYHNYTQIMYEDLMGVIHYQLFPVTSLEVLPEKSE